MSTHQSTSLSDDLVQFVASDVAIGGGHLDSGTDLVDSLGVMMVVDWLEQRLDIDIDPNDVVIEHFESVDAIIGYLRGRDDCRFE